MRRERLMTEHGARRELEGGGNQLRLGGQGQLHKKGTTELRPRGWGGACHRIVIPYLTGLAKTKIASHLSSPNPGSS